MPNAVKQPRKTVLLTFNPQDEYVQSFLQTLRLSKKFIIEEGKKYVTDDEEESPYDPVYVARAKRAAKGSFVKVDLDHFWD